MKILLIITWVIAVLSWCLFAFVVYSIHGNELECPGTMYESPINKQQAVDYLKRMQYSHQYYVDNPEKCNKTTGNVSRNIILVNEYQQLIDYITSE